MSLNHTLVSEGPSGIFLNYLNMIEQEAITIHSRESKIVWLYTFGYMTVDNTEAGSDSENYGIRITSDLALVEEYIHDLFVELWEKKNQIGEIRSFKHFNFAAFRRKIFRSLQKFRKFSLLEEPAYGLTWYVSAGLWK